MNYDAWLCSIPGLYWNAHDLLLRYFGSAKGVYEARETELASLEKEGHKWTGAVLEARQDSFVRNVESLLESGRIRFAARSDKAFPSLLTKIPDCPAGLFYKGRLPEEKEKLAAIVGARGCTPYGSQMARKIARALAKEGFGIISGMAVGIDGIAQRSALEAGGSSFSVLGCGADICYPPDHISLYSELCEKGGVISEFPCRTQPLKSHFPLRNRLISGMAKAVIVIEARKKSGSLITADLALEQGRDVYALPGRVGDPLSEGCNLLIAQGSLMVTSPEDLVADLTGKKPGKGLASSEKRMAAEDLNGEEKLVYSLIGNRTVSVQALAAETALSASMLGRILLQLEMKDLIVYAPGNSYMRKD